MGVARVRAGALLPLVGYRRVAGRYEGVYRILGMDRESILHRHNSRNRGAKVIKRSTPPGLGVAGIAIPEPVAVGVGVAQPYPVVPIAYMHRGSKPTVYI